MFKKLGIGLLLCSLWAVSASAQRLEIGGWLGSSFYFGDLNNHFSLNRPGLAGGGMARFNWNSRVSTKLGVSYGRISADDADSNFDYERARNLSFRSDIVDGTLQMEFNFLPYTHGSRDEFFTPYIALGGGICRFNPKTYYKNEWVELNPLGTEGQYLGSEYALLVPQLTYALGVKGDINRLWSINFEVSGRKLWTDYLDDVSGNYTDPANLKSLRGNVAVELADRSLLSPEGGTIGQPTRQRGNGWKNDSYVFVGIGIMYNFNNVKCFKW